MVIFHYRPDRPVGFPRRTFLRLAIGKPLVGCPQPLFFLANPPVTPENVMFFFLVHNSQLFNSSISSLNPELQQKSFFVSEISANKTQYSQFCQKKGTGIEFLSIFEGCLSAGDQRPQLVST